MSDVAASVIAHPASYAGEIAVRLAWLAPNGGLAPGIGAWDPYPLQLLAVFHSTPPSMGHCADVFTTGRRIPSPWAPRGCRRALAITDP